MIVVDANLVAYYWLGRDRVGEARRVRKRDGDWHAPRLWRSEFRNVLRTYLTRGTLTLADALWFAEKAERDLRGRGHDVRTRDVLKLVEQTGHSAYDCEYVALAQAHGVPLVTGDREVVRLFPDTAVLLEDFAAGAG